MFPLHTTRIAAIGRARSLAVALSRPIAARPPRGRCRRRGGSPARDRAARPRSRRAPRAVRRRRGTPRRRRRRPRGAPRRWWPGPRPTGSRSSWRAGRPPSTARASRWSGIRTPIDAGSPPRSQSRLRGARGTTSVSAPGHRAAARRSARSSSCATARASAIDATRTGSVRSDGRCFASNTRAVAAGSSGRAAIPYTVSVGKTTSSPRRAAATASADRVAAHGRRPDTTRSRPLRSVWTRDVGEPRRLGGGPDLRTRIVVDLDGDRATRSHPRAASSNRRRYRPRVAEHGFVRVGEHVARERVAARRRHVRRVRADEIDPLLEARRASPRTDRPGRPSRRGCNRAAFARASATASGRDVRREDARAGVLVGDRERDRAASRCTRRRRSGDRSPRRRADRSPRAPRSRAAARTRPVAPRARAGGTPAPPSGAAAGCPCTACRARDRRPWPRPWSALPRA